MRTEPKSIVRTRDTSVTQLIHFSR